MIPKFVTQMTAWLVVLPEVAEKIQQFKEGARGKFTFRQFGQVSR